MAQPPTKTTEGPEPLAHKDLVAVLLRHYEIHEGEWDILVELMLGAGPIKPAPDQAYPGALVGITRIGIQKTEIKGPATVDASVVNPAAKAK